MNRTGNPAPAAPSEPDEALPSDTTSASRKEAPAVPTARPPGRRSFLKAPAAFPIALVALAGVMVLSLRIGALPISNSDMLNALFSYSEDSYGQRVVRDLRIPRTLMGAVVGAALALSGVMMQAITRNPLAGPSILGVNSGAAFAIVTAVSFGGLANPMHYIWFAFAGGGAAALLVYTLGSMGSGGASPVKLALAGVIVSILLNSWLTALMLLDSRTLDAMRFWLAGSISGRDLSVMISVLPFLAAGVIGALFLAAGMNVIALGEDTARSLGMRLGAVRGTAAILTVLAAAASVAVAGPIGFVGLAVPHLVRGMVGSDYRVIVPMCLVTGPAVLLGADILGRAAAYPSELQVGIVTSLVGAPVLIILARRRAAAL